MKKPLISLALVLVVLIIFLSYFVVSQTKGRFVIGNEPPYVVTNTFAAKDGPAAGNWDNVVVIDTHDLDTKLRFNVKDPNPDVLDVRLCIGTSPDPSGAGDCNVVNYDFSGVAPGQHAPSGGAQLTYTYNTDPIGTLEGTPAVIEIIPADCSGATCSKTYYADIIIDDRNGEIITTAYEFNIINNVPDTPLGLSPITTHDQTPDLSWTATDPDDGTVDKWPADTLTHHIQVGTNYGLEEYLADPSTASASATVTNPIPWGTPGATQAITTVYVTIWSQDNLGIDSTHYEIPLDLIDNLPQFVDVFAGDDVVSLASCTAFLPVQNCFIDPKQGTYTSENIKLSINDADLDCSGLTHTANAVLCLVDIAGPEVCDPTTNNYRNYALTFEESDGANCNFSISILEGDPNGIEFFKAPGIYKMYVDSASQAGMSTTFSTGQQWEYTILQAVDYTDTVYLGDRVEYGGDGIQLGQWNPGLSLAVMTNFGNSILNLEWEATDPSTGGETCDGHTTTCWDLSTADDFQIDDDTDQADDTGNLAAVNILEEVIPSQRVPFRPVPGLEICDVMTCDSPALQETLDTYFHIKPPVGLSLGTYDTDITVTMSIL